MDKILAIETGKLALIEDNRFGMFHDDVSVKIRPLTPISGHLSELLSLGENLILSVSQKINILNFFFLKMIFSQ